MFLQVGKSIQPVSYIYPTERSTLTLIMTNPFLDYPFPHYDNTYNNQQGKHIEISIKNSLVSTENIVAKGEVAYSWQFLILPQCFKFYSNITLPFKRNFP